MALFTSVQTGDFNSSSTWDVGSGFPGSSDTFAIVATHVVTVPNALSATSSGTIGGSSDPNRGELVIEDGGLLTLNGDLVLTNWNHLQIDGGGELDIDGNNVTVDNSTANVNKITLVGTSLNRVKVSSSTVGVGNFQRDSGGGMPGWITIDYCDFIDCGKIEVGDNFFSPNKLDIQHTVFVGCDQPTLGGFQDGGNDYIISGIDVREDRSSTGYVMQVHRADGSNATGSGTQTIEKITADSNTATGIRWQVDGIDRTCVVTDRLLHTSVTGREYAVTKSLLRLPSASGSSIEDGGVDEISDSYLFSDGDNPHTISATVDLLQRGVIEATYAGGYTDDGDHFIVSTTRDQSVDSALVIDEHSGVLVNALGVAKTATYNATNCTLYGNYDSVYGALARNETGGSFAGTFNTQSNLVYSRVADARGFNIETAGDDQVTLMDYNAWFNVTDQYHGVTSATKTPGVTAGYGANDFNDIDPTFVDSTRNLASWGGLVTGTATADAAIDHLMTINGYNSTSKTQVAAEIVTDTPLDAVTWVRDGFAPTNTAYQGTSHDGGDVGAVAWVAASTGGGTVGTLGSTVLSSIQKTVTATIGRSIH
jgi:hypothetical protein